MFFLLVKISDLIAEFKLNQQIQGRKDMYMKLTTYRLKLAILHGRKLQCDRNIKNIPMHIKEYIHFCQNVALKKLLQFLLER